MVDDNQTYCGDHFVMYTNGESLSCTHETNMMLYVNNTSIINKKKEKKKWEIELDVIKSSLALRFNRILNSWGLAKRSC